MFVDALKGITVNDGAIGAPGSGLLQNMGLENQFAGPARWQSGFSRPYINNHGQRCVTLNTGKMIRDDNAPGGHRPELKSVLISSLQARGINNLVWNATTLTKEAWIELDRKVMKVYRKRLRAWADLEARHGLSVPNGMNRMTYEYQVMSDPGEAINDMDGLNDGRNDTPLLKLRSVPLTIWHSDFMYSQRMLDVSGMQMPMSEAAARRVGEGVEKSLLGIGGNIGIEYGTQSTGVTAHDGYSKVYGYTTLPSRIAMTTITTPTGSNPEVTVAQVLSLRNTMYGYNFFGPYMLYHSTDWDTYLDNDYARLGGSNANMTLRDRLRKIDGIEDVKRLDYLDSGTNPFTFLLIQFDADTAQALTWMEITTLQWASQGGLRQNFKVMCGKVPLLKYDYNGVAAIQHATTS